jgi:hypothetical protein
MTAGRADIETQAWIDTSGSEELALARSDDLPKASARFRNERGSGAARRGSRSCSPRTASIAESLASVAPSATCE